MTEQSSGQGRSDEWGRGGYVPGEQYADEQYYGAFGSPRPGQAGSGSGGYGPGRTMMGSQAADGRGFLSALFDFSFTSFVTTRIIKVLYVLILIMVLLSALIFTYDMFRVSALTGLLTLVIGDPLFIVIVMAFWRLVLESFVVRFRIAEDVRAMRERGGR
jgi:hypothetical protein